MGENRLNDIKKQKRNIRIFSSNALKIIACVSMLIDHIGIVFVDNNLFMRAVGRLAFPVFAFLLVQGLLRTSDVRRYLLRLGIFAVVSEMPFDLAMHDTIWYPGAQNIFFTNAPSSGRSERFCAESVCRSGRKGAIDSDAPVRPDAEVVPRRRRRRCALVRADRFRPRFAAGRFGFYQRNFPVVVRGRAKRS